ncbi:MAG TPA: acyloxyacyl hydrolase [Syntrophales bacterium]|nr:acyloxyacyl hydrolase [Syntrophales bacterium]
MLMLRRALLVTVLVVVIIVLPGNNAYCADEAKKDGHVRDSFFTEMGFITGFGTGSLPEGNYQPIYLIGHFGVDMKRYFSGLKDHKGTLSVFLEPQFNPVVSPQNDFEAGVGIGLKYMYPVLDKLSVYVLGSVGPHYVSVQTSKQANGFIFADTIGGGIYYYLTKDTAINLGYRLRHMSNANTAEPNGGIDTNSAVIGYSVFFD